MARKTALVRVEINIDIKRQIFALKYRSSQTGRVRTKKGMIGLIRFYLLSLNDMQQSLYGNLYYMFICTYMYGIYLTYMHIYFYLYRYS